MKKEITFFVMTLFFLIQILYSQNTDESRFGSAFENWQNADRGILLNETGAEENRIAEILFENKESNMKMYYTGSDYRGHGVFWIYKNSQKEIILETNIRYGPAIFWHNGTVAEIIVPTGSPFSHSFFYDFEDNQLSSAYSFPIYYDINNKVVIIWGVEDFELHDIKTNEILKTYYARRPFGLTAFWPYIEYYIEKSGSEIVLYYNDSYENNKGRIVLE
jgi:hypothetical protein